MADINYCNYKSPIGNLRIEADENGICRVELCKNTEQKEDSCNLLLKKAIQQLEEYFKGNRKEFDLPLSLKGTEFQIKVWNELQKIPYGEVCCYKDIAERIGNPKSCRAVGMANNRNPIMIIVPCHRVIGKSGNMVGYACGIDKKQWLLKFEADNKNIM